MNGVVQSNVVPSADITFDLGSTSARWNGIHGEFLDLNSSQVTASSGNTINIGALVVNSSITANSGTIYHDLTIGGNLFITGNVVATNVETLAVTDPMIHLGTNNHTSDTLDLGFYSDYYDGTTIRYSGLIRDASDKNYKIGRAHV